MIILPIGHIDLVLTSMEDAVSKNLSVADAKKHLSELMSRVAYNNERFLIERHGKPVAALVSVEDLAKLEREPKGGQGLLAAVGACADFEEWNLMIENIYLKREQAQDRDVDLDE